jgi:hypothetical protein
VPLPLKQVLSQQSVFAAQGVVDWLTRHVPLHDKVCVSAFAANVAMQYFEQQSAAPAHVVPIDAQHVFTLPPEFV